RGGAGRAVRAVGSLVADRTAHDPPAGGRAGRRGGVRAGRLGPGAALGLRIRALDSGLTDVGGEGEDMRRRFSVLLFALVLATGLIAPAAPAAPVAQNVTLNAWVRNYTLETDSPWKTAKAAFEAKHPGVTVELSGAPYDEQYQRIILSKAGG